MTQAYQVVDSEHEYSIYEIRCAASCAGTARQIFVEAQFGYNLTQIQKTILSERLEIINITGHQL